MERKKVSFIHSIKAKIVALIAVSIIVVVFAIMIVTIPKIRSVVSSLTRNYMLDAAKISGEALDREIALEGYDKTFNFDVLKKELKDVKVEGLDSSYAYVLSMSGSVFYHPDQKRIGKKVDNDAIAQVVEKVKKGERPEANTVTYKDKQSKKVMYAAYYVGENLDFILIVTAEEQEAFKDTNELVTSTTIIGLVIFIVCSLFGLAIAIMIIKPIENTTVNISKLADLDFTKTAENNKNRKDETGIMMNSISVLRDKLSDVVTIIRDHSETLAASSTNMENQATKTTNEVGKVERAISNIANSAVSQAGETQKATENIIVIGNMIEQTTDEVDMLENTSKKMLQSGEQAIGILERLKEINKETVSAIEVISDQTDHTSASVKKIKEATEIIAEIASETNLLSLNASIEAARAGEQGRGFAVVATQIQKLADQSSQSASYIDEIIEELIEDSKKSVETMKSVHEVIAKQNFNVNQTEKAFNEVKDGIDKSMTGVSSISKMTEQLDEARVRIVDALQSLTAIAEENAASAEETSVSAREVNDVIKEFEGATNNIYHIALELDEKLKEFKL